jgi:Zinc dependent phospholipase C
MNTFRLLAGLLGLKGPHPPRISAGALALSLALLGAPPHVQGWNNGPPGNTTTDTATECGAPPYSTHDWVADHALALLPEEERAWLMPHHALYLLGTEAPDNRTIAAACTSPHRGYDDRRLGHSVEWTRSWSRMTNDRAARRAQEEYDKAAVAFRQGNRPAAAFYLGAMAHYIGDVSQYGHAIQGETHHGDYESWVGSQTGGFVAGRFEVYIVSNGLVRRSAYTAVKRISRVTARGEGAILPAVQMDRRFTNKDQAYLDSIGHALNLGVNELADVLHTFYLAVVAEEE